MLGPYHTTSSRAKVGRGLRDFGQQEKETAGPILLGYSKTLLNPASFCHEAVRSLQGAASVPANNCYSSSLAVQVVQHVLCICLLNRGLIIDRKIEEHCASDSPVLSTISNKEESLLSLCPPMRTHLII